MDYNDDDADADDVGDDRIITIVMSIIIRSTAMTTWLMITTIILLIK